MSKPIPNLQEILDQRAAMRAAAEETADDITFEASKTPILTAVANKLDSNLITDAPKASETLVVAASGIKALNNKGDWIAFIHQMAPVIVSTLVGINVVTQDKATFWLPFVFAVVDNMLSVGSTTDRARRAIHAVFLLLQSGSGITTLVAELVHSPEQVVTVTSVITGAITIVSSFLARFYAPTSTSIPATLVDSVPNPPVLLAAQPIQTDLPSGGDPWDTMPMPIQDPRGDAGNETE